MISFLSMAELERKFSFLETSHKDVGTIKLLVCRPVKNERKIIEEAEITTAEGLIGDYWKDKFAEGKEDTKTQITLVNIRLMNLIAGDKENWPPARDQLYVDFDLNKDNIPAGQKLTLGPDDNVILEISDIHHTGCHKFKCRFGKDATRFMHASKRKHLQLRVVNAKVIRSGKKTVHDQIKKLE